MAGDGTTFTGNVTSTRTSYQTLTNKDVYEAQLKFACFTKNNLTRVIGAEAFGVESLKNPEVFSAARPTGRIIRYDSGGYQVSGPVFTEGGSAFYVGRMGSHSPHLTEGGDEWAYSWHDLNAVEFCPTTDKEDNGKGHIDILMHKQQAMMNTLVNEFNYALLGNSSGASYGVMGPSAVNSDLPYLISVDQDTAVGGIDPTSLTYWQNQTKQLTSIGGGGEYDRPILLYRALQDVFLDTLQLGEATSASDYMLLTTQGGYQLFDRLQFADGRDTGSFTFSNKYDPAGVKTFAFMGAPIIWDPAVVTPYGASSTSTEVFYGVHIPSFAVSIRKDAGNFSFTGWERPRVHEQYKTLMAAVRVRFTPMVTARRPHFVLYDIPQCQD